MKKLIIPFLAILVLLATREPKAYATANSVQDLVLKPDVYTEEVYTTNNSVIGIHIPTPEKENIGTQTPTTDKENKNFVGDFYDCLIKCESGYNSEAVGDHGQSKGILQFKLETFTRHCVKEYGLASEKDWLDPVKQLLCCKKMVESGLEGHWTCAKQCR